SRARQRSWAAAWGGAEALQPEELGASAVAVVLQPVGQDQPGAVVVGRQPRLLQQRQQPGVAVDHRSSLWWGKGRWAGRRLRRPRRRSAARRRTAGAAAG